MPYRTLQVRLGVSSPAGHRLGLTNVWQLTWRGCIQPDGLAGENWSVWMIRVVLAQPRGFCAGVERAIEIVERALKTYGAQIYVCHEIVHNRHVVEDLRTRGAVFVDELDEIPPGSITVFSAHGVAKRVEEAASERGLPVIDATCPLVAKVHNEG